MYTDILDLWANTLQCGKEIRPRGELVKELADTQFQFSPTRPFQEYTLRKYNLTYFRQEMRWKLGASKFDDSIKAHAKMWESVQNPDGSFNSNYGQYWFGSQMGIWKVFMELVRDSDSRRATIPMLTDAHLTPETTDTVCTEAVTFRIRDHTLHMSVHMRSSDQVFGLGTDCPTFAVLYQLLFGLLRDYYHGLKQGHITVTAASSHVYERHFKMIQDVLKDQASSPIHLPECSGFAEAVAIISARGRLAFSEPSWKLAEFIHD